MSISLRKFVKIYYEISCEFIMKLWINFLYYFDIIIYDINNIMLFIFQNILPYIIDI